VPKIREGERATVRLEKVFSDIMGPEDVSTKAGKKYMLNFIDDATGMTWIYPPKEKLDATQRFKEWKALVEKESGTDIKILRTENGSKYTSKDFETYLRTGGVQHELMAPYTSAQNGKAECCHRTIMNRAHAIQSDARLPPSLWGECVKATRYIKNHSATRTLKNKTPFEAWYGRCPDLSNLRKLGCKAWVYIMTENPKIYSRSIECILVGYSEISKAY
jgi:hypothetical protein